MDRVLRDIQVELAPERDPAPAFSGSPPATAAPPPPSATAAPPAPPTPTSDAPDYGAPRAPSRPWATQPTPETQALSRLTARLLASMRELLDGYEQVLVQ